MQSMALTKAIHAYVRNGQGGMALQTLIQREKLNNEASGQRREQALNKALSRFQATGNPNALVPFYNQFVSGTDEISGIVRQGEMQDGKPMYVMYGNDYQTGKSFANPISHHQLNQILHAATDPSLMKSIFVQQAKTMNNLEEERGKQKILGDKEIRVFDHKTPVEHRNRLNLIYAQGAEARRNQEHSNRLAVKGAAPAEVRTAEWLVANGVAPDHDSAWQMVRSLKTQTREQFIQNTTAQLLKGNADSLTGEILTPQHAAQQAAEIYDAIAQVNGSHGQAVEETSDQAKDYSPDDQQMVLDWMKQKRPDAIPEQPEYLQIKESASSGFIEPADNDKHTRLREALRHREAHTLPPTR